MTETPEQPDVAPESPAPVEPAETDSFDDAQERSGAAEEAAFARGEALSWLGAEPIAAGRRATVVVLMGNSDCGKTTLLASLYERFGLGRLAGHWFLGSRTLHGFELRCHRSCFGEGPGGGSDGHTAGDAPPWLHLRTSRQERPRQIYELLLGDFSGDHHSKPIADGSRKAAEFTALRRADHVCVAIDGGRMSDPARQEAEQRFIRDLLTGLLHNSEALASPSAISFVVTKWDLVDASETGRDSVEGLFSELRELVPEGDRVGFLETAARSSTPDFPIGYGVGDLLSRWTDRAALHIRHPLPPTPEATDPLHRFEYAPGPDQEPQPTPEGQGAEA
jgi:double-GTPase-like protein